MGGNFAAEYASEIFRRENVPKIALSSRGDRHRRSRRIPGLDFEEEGTGRRSDVAVDPRIDAILAEAGGEIDHAGGDSVRLVAVAD